MLKLVFPRPHSEHGGSARRRTRDRGRTAAEAIAEQRGAGESAQRAVARGRQQIVELHSCLQQPSGSEAETAEGLAGQAVREELAARLDDIHQRLLLFSTSIELEMDRLDMVRGEIEQLTRTGQTDGGQP